jgi:alpha-tubulin suppressor-like RCC1 family protein
MDTTTALSLTLFPFVLVVTQDGRVWCWGLGTQGSLGLGDNTTRMKPAPIPARSFNFARIRSVACGAFFTLALTEQAELFAWGQNLFGVLAQNDENNRLVPTPINTGEHKVKLLSAGAHHALLVTHSGQLFTWGDGSHGAHGLDHRKTRRLPTLVDAHIFGDAPLVEVITMLLIHYSCMYVCAAFIPALELHIMPTPLSISTSPSGVPCV